MLAPSQDNSARPASALPFWRANPPAAAALAIALVCAGAIAGAWFFEFVIKLKPCPMCLEERVPYYVGVPLALIVALAAWRRAPRAIVLIGLAALALLMLWNASMGVYHSGVEWKLWAGPRECTGEVVLGPASDLMKRLQNINLTRCDEAAWRLFGISLAGYSALISLALTAVALWGAKAGSRRSAP